MRTIELSHGEVALVDDDNYDVLSMFKWHTEFCPDGIKYAKSTMRVGTKHLRMHRLIMRKELELDESMLIDHINRDGLDNQRHNLRLATSLQNAMNRKVYKNNVSGVRGVCRNPKKHEARGWIVTYRGKLRGKFVELDDAIALRLHLEQTESVYDG